MIDSLNLVIVLFFLPEWLTFSKQTITNPNYPHLRANSEKAQEIIVLAYHKHKLDTWESTES